VTNDKVICILVLTLLSTAHIIPNSFCIRIVTNSEDVDIENQLNITVIFPDSSLPEPTNGGFSSQEEFRNYVMQHQKDGQWSSALHSRPLAERLADYKDETIALAFPLQFPYGHTGLPDDPAVQKLASKPRWKRHMSRNRDEVLKKFLQHRKPEFHSAMFNLITQSILMKASIFRSTKMYCSIKAADGTTMSEQ